MKFKRLWHQRFGHDDAPALWLAEFFKRRPNATSVAVTCSCGDHIEVYERGPLIRIYP